jgi:glycosyltransferase involved in cell wall biosynthesis
MAIVSGDFVKTGGMDRANYALADYLSRSGRPLELVAHRVAGELVGRADVAFRRVPKPLGSYTLGEPLLDRGGRRASKRVLARGGVAVLNGGNCLARGVNWVHYVHAAYHPEQPWNVAGVRRRWVSRLAERREAAALGLAELVIANSEATRRVLIERLGVRPERAFVVYYGMDASQFALGSAEAAAEARSVLGWPDRPVLAFVGALGDRRKGFDTLFDAFRELCRESSWDVDLVAVGAGAELETWRARAAGYGLSERVRLLGFRKDVDRILAAADGLAAPTRYEAFGLGVAEALATGLPALVSSAAGVAELYPEALRDLLLEDPESSRELAAKLRSWRASLPSGRARMASLSERVRARTWDAMSADIEALIERHVPQR